MVIGYGGCNYKNILTEYKCPQTDTPNPSQQQKKTGLQWRGKDFSFARPQSTPTLPTSPAPNTPHSPLTAPTTPVNNSSPLLPPSHPLTPTQPEHTDTHSIVTSSLDQGTQDTSRTLGPTLSEHKPVVNMIKSPPLTSTPPKMPLMPVYNTTPSPLQRGVVKPPTHTPPTPVLHAQPLTPTAPKTAVRPVVSTPLVPEDRKRKADQMAANNTPEAQYKRRVIVALQSDAKSAGQPALTPFLNCEDVLTRLLPFHIFQPVEHDAPLDTVREEELQSRYQQLLEEYHAHSAVSACSEETLLMERLLWSEQREELQASRELLNKYLAQLQQQRQLQQQLLLNSTPSAPSTAMHTSTPLTPGAVKVIASTPHTAPRNPPLNVAVMAPGMGKTGLLSAQTMALIQKVAHHQAVRPSVVTPVNVVPVPPSISKDEHVINLLPQNKS